MESAVFVTGADRGLGFAICVGLLEKGWRVFAGQYMPEWPDLSTLGSQYPDALHIIPLNVSSGESARVARLAVEKITDRLDVLISNAGVSTTTSTCTIREHPDYNEMHRLYDVNALGALRAVETFLPLMDRGRLKRLCFVSSEAGSIGRAERTSWFGYCMSKAALNMGVKILFNNLHPEGYTFRVYHPGWIRSYMGGKKNREATFEPEEAAAMAIRKFLDTRDDEEHIMMVDYDGKEWPW